MIYKLNLLKTSLHIFDISKNIQMAKETFKKLLSEIPEIERDNFSVLVSMILISKDN